MLYIRYHWYNMPIRDGIMVSLSMMASSFSLWWNESSWHQFCSPLQDATSNWSFLKPLKLVRSLRSAVQRSAAKSTYWLIACFCDSQADKIPRQLGLAWTLHCHRLVSGLAYESSSVGIAVRLSCVGPLTSFDIGKLRSINLSGKQHDFWPFSILVWGPLLRSLAFDPMTCNSFIYIIYIYMYTESWVSEVFVNLSLLEREVLLTFLLKLFLHFSMCMANDGYQMNWLLQTSNIFQRWTQNVQKVGLIFDQRCSCVALFRLAGSPVGQGLSSRRTAGHLYPNRPTSDQHQTNKSTSATSGSPVRVIRRRG